MLDLTLNKAFDFACRIAGKLTGKWLRTVMCCLVISSGLANKGVAAPVDEPPSDRAEQRELALQYAHLVGRLALAEKLFAAMSARCDVPVSMPSESHSAIDYAIRQQTGYSFTGWQQFFSSPEHEAKMVKELLESTLTDIGGCERDAVTTWYKGMQQNMLQPGIKQLSALSPLWGLLPKPPGEQQLSAIFRQKLARFNTLSVAEVRGLASALSSGIYMYSAAAFAHPVNKDIQQAVVLREYVYNQAPNAAHLYELANSVQAIDKQRALPLFKQAAEQGDFFAQRWWGNYQACQGQTDKALHWLTLAKQTMPDEASFIDDIIAEINELGEPTNCIDGWVQ